MAADATREAATQAKSGLEGQTPKLAIVFASPSYPDVADVAGVVRETVGDVPIVGGTAGGCVIGPDGIAARGVSIMLLAGDDLEVALRSVACSSPDCLEAVGAAQEIAREADAAARRGFTYYACLVFGPGVSVDGEALVAAVRKGAGARAQLFGGLTGDDLTMDRSKVLSEGSFRDDRVVLAGLYTKRPIGVAARHGFEAVGPVRTVTRTEDVWLCELDRHPALDVWLEDARRAGATPPAERKDIALYLANHFDLGIAEPLPTPRSFPVGSDSDSRELVARAPFAVREDGALKLSASLAEGTRVRVLHGVRNDLLRASTEAASAAVLRAETPAGALVLPCSGRLAALGPAFAEEVARVRERVGAPVGGACVFGEIARNVRDADAFFNVTMVVVVFAA